ncbi:MAG: hypothetical protein OT477_06420 [Chloroflexi bacterium]|nr:hypothetical protein [Chloroflexota bacterium]
MNGRTAVHLPLDSIILFQAPPAPARGAFLLPMASPAEDKRTHFQ